MVGPEGLERQRLTAFDLPLIAGYSVFVYRVFGGKATELRYD